MKNKDLRSFYANLYKKGERKHYTALLFSKELPEEMAAVIDEIPSWRGKTVVDVGCGTGRIGWELVHKGAKHFLGIDYAPSAIEEAQHHYLHPNLDFREMDVKNLRGTFDVVISLGTLEHMDDPLALLKTLKRHVKPGGSLIVTCPNWVNPRGYFLQTLELLFKAPITLADLHYLTPIEFQAWSKRLRMPLSWKTVDHDWAHGKLLIKDFKRRIPNVLRDAKLPRRQSQIDAFIRWIEKHVLPLDHETAFSGATGLYHFRRPN